MVGSDIITIVIVLGIGYWLFSTGKLDQIFGQLQLGASGGGESTSPGEQQAYAEQTGGEGNHSRINQTNGEVDVDISGPNSGAMVNGKCYGNPAQCAKAQNLLEQIT